MDAPVGGERADLRIRIEIPQHLLQSVIATHLQELVCVEERHPAVPVPKQCDTLVVHRELLVVPVHRGMVVAVCKGTRVYERGVVQCCEHRRRPIVHDVEAADLVVVVVVRKPLGQVGVLVFDGQADRNVFVGVAIFEWCGGEGR